MINCTSLNEYIGVKVDLSYESAMDTDSAILRDLLYKHKLLVFKGWHNLEPEQLTKFSQKFGTIWSQEKYKMINEDVKTDNSGLAYTEYTDKSYDILSTGIPWHVDIANEPIMEKCPSRVLYCKGLPSHFEGFTTDISNMVAAYENLTPSFKKFFDSVYLTYQSWQKPGRYIREYPAVATHPYTKEKYLRFNAVSKTAGWVRDWFTKLPDNTKKYHPNELLKKIIEEKGDAYKYCHSWDIGDLIIFDNWGTMHRKGDGILYEDNVGVRSFIRITIDTGFKDETHTSV